MPTVPAITDAEWPLMKILWDQGGGPLPWLAAADIVDPVCAQRPIHHRTARTLLARLVKKGAVESRPGDTGAGNLYRAKVPRDAVTRRESHSFLARVFDGNAAPALVHLLKQSRRTLSPQEIHDLRSLLNRREDGQ